MPKPDTQRKTVYYDFAPQQETLMVAEAPAPYGEKKE